MVQSEWSMDAKSLTLRVLEVLPQPFEWCAIPEGDVVILHGDWNRVTPTNLEVDRNFQIQSREHYSVQAFYMAKYPLTVAQYEPFVQDGGYDKPVLWTDEGWKWKYDQDVIIPRYWKNEKWHIADHPIVCITQYEALAYTRWLSDKIDLSIRLATEPQWQRAASGDDRRLYPWGETFDSNKANTFESRIARTTPVTQYPGGESAYGVMDMSGNIWEWTHPLENSDNAVRGGSFNSESEMARVTARRRHSAWSWDYSVGMRLVCNW